MCVRLICKYSMLFLEKSLCVFCPPIYRLFYSDCNQSRNSRCPSFICGFCLGQAYYYYLLKKIAFPYQVGVILSLIISVLLGIGNAISIQIRCICLLIFPMYCGKAGRGVLKAVVLTYVVAGPITNMGINAREVVRVFACTTELSYNLTRKKYDVMCEPLRKTALSLTTELELLKETISELHAIVEPIERDIENTEEMEQKLNLSAYIKRIVGIKSQHENIHDRIRLKLPDIDDFQSLYQKKLSVRCEYQIIRALAVCHEAFASAYNDCLTTLPEYAAIMICWPLKLENVCNLTHRIEDICNDTRVNQGVGTGYATLKSIKNHLFNGLLEVSLQYKIAQEQKLQDIQDAAETGARVMHAFEEKHIIMGTVITMLNIFMAVFFLRIVVAAVVYHDMYLTSIEYDNIYVTGYFKILDDRRKCTGKFTLLPLKKMERSKYIDIHSISYKAPEHNKLLTQMLKVMLEVVTATTFVMLDRLFYEALDVVRQHAQIDAQDEIRDLEVNVKGTGILATLLQKLSSNLSSMRGFNRMASNKLCLPQPRSMPPVYFFKIYGGYLWILLLLYINPYTLRLRRLICSYFYPRREKQRILHLYNDILKKRLKMQKTLRRKAVQAARAHYLSGENLLSLRMKFPQTLGWMRIIPAARMTCLICGETEPRVGQKDQKRWHSCSIPKCPFVFCNECWSEAGARCLACDPSLADLSDIDSLSEDDQPRY